MVNAPGLEYVARFSAHFFIPCAFVYGVVWLGCNSLDLTLSKWALAISSIASRLGYIIARPWYDEYNNAQIARAKGAVLAPHIKEKHTEVISSLTQELVHGYPAQTFAKWCSKYGNAFRFSVGLDERYFTTEPEHIKSMLSTDFESWEKGQSHLIHTRKFANGNRFHRSITRPFFSRDRITDFEVFERHTEDALRQAKDRLAEGYPIDFQDLASRFTLDSATDFLYWMNAFHRSITRPFFSRDRITDFEVFERHTEDALRQAKDRLAEGYPIDFQDLASRFTLDSATDFLFKSDVHSLGAGLPYPSAPSPLAKPNPPSFVNHPSNTFVEAFVVGLGHMARRAQLGALWPLAEMWGDVVVPYRDEVHRFIEPFMEKGFREKNVGSESGGNSETLLHYLFSQTSDRKIIKDELINLLVAARDTTAALLTFSLAMISEHPDMHRRLGKEILTHVGPERCPTTNDIREMKFLRAFFNEVLRLYAIVPINGREAMKPVILAPTERTKSPIYVPAGSRFVYSVFLMHRRTDLWGPDGKYNKAITLCSTSDVRNLTALEFDPDRFLDERVHKYLVPNPFIFCPFNAGPRICLGQQFAYNEASFFLIRLLQRFSSFSLEPRAQPPDSFPNPEWAGCPGPQGRDRIRLKTHLTMYVKGGLWVRMTEAAGSEVDA
ncbi:Cytochrome P450 52A3-A [Leucoagaricus sp. SymC.cos]|nr:Cytochrome P450 52A3-A [Leucoagaricus sp. SymC.cos]